MIIFRYRAPGLPCVLEYLQNTAKGCVRLAIAIHPLLTERMVPSLAAQGHTPTLLLDTPTETAYLGEAQCATGAEWL